MNFNLDMETFYKIGMTCFLVMGIFNSLNFIASWELLTIFSRVSSVAGIVLNFAFFLLFNKLRGDAKEAFTEEYSSDSLDEVIKHVTKKN